MFATLTIIVLQLYNVEYEPIMNLLAQYYFLGRVCETHIFLRQRLSAMEAFVFVTFVKPAFICL